MQEITVGKRIENYFGGWRRRRRRRRETPEESRGVVAVVEEIKVGSGLLIDGPGEFKEYWARSC